MDTYSVSGAPDARALRYHRRDADTAFVLRSGRCLRSLTRQNCPLCRTPFQYDDVRKLHIDKCSRPSTPLHHSSAPGTPDSGYNEFPTPARDFHTRITRIVLDGAKATEVRDFLDEVRRWLATQPSDEVPPTVPSPRDKRLPVGMCAALRLASGLPPPVQVHRSAV